MATGPLAQAAVEIIAELERFEPDLRRKLVQAVQSAADDAEKEFRKRGARSGKTFADATAKAVTDGKQFTEAGSDAGGQFAQAFTRDASGRLRDARGQFVRAGGQAGDAFGAQFTRDANGRLRDAQGRFVREGETAGGGWGDGFSRGARRAADRGGQDAGGFFSRAFESAASRAVGQGLFQALAAGAAGLVTAVSPVSTVLGGAAAAAVALAAALAQASGSALALGGVLGAVGLAAATVKVGTAGLDDAFKAQAKALAELTAEGKVSSATQQSLSAAMKGLAPAAQEVVRALGAQAGAWSSLQRSVQQELFQGVGAEISRLASTFLPILRTQLTNAAGTLNSFVRQFTQFLTSGDRPARINAILTQLNEILASFLPLVVPLSEAFLTLFEASLPFAKELADAITQVGLSFASWAKGIVKSGEFAEFMRGAMDAAGALLGILGNLSRILFSVFTAGSDSGRSLLQLFEDLTGRLADFLDSAQGQAALESFFGLIASAGSVLLTVFSALQPAIAGIAAVFTALQGPLQALGAALGPVVGQLFVTLGAALTTLAPQIAALVTGLTPLITAIGGGLVAVFQALLTAILPLVPPFVQIVTLIAAQMVPIIGQLVPVLLTVVEAFGTLVAAVIPLVPPLLSLIPALAQISLSLAQMLVAAAPLVTVIAQFAAMLIGAAAPAIAVAVAALVGLLGGINSLIGGVTRVIGAVANFVSQVLANFQTLRSQGAGLVEALVGAIVGATSGMVGRVVGFFSSMVSQASGVLSGFIGSARDLAAGIASGIVGAIRSGLSAVAGAFRAPFDAARGAVSSALSSILSTVEGFVSRISGAISRISGAISRIPRPNFPGIDIPGLANGGITRGLSFAGEAGPEVVIPMTKPRRRDQLLEQYFGGWADQRAFGNGGGPYGGKTTTVHIPINAPYAGRDELAKAIVDEIEKRDGRRIGITTSKGDL